MRNLVWLIVLGVILSGCGGNGKDNPECTSHVGNACLQGAVFSVDSCGNPEEVLEYCPCGCDAGGDACESCTCTCSEVGECCDGCFLYPEGRVCDDGNPDTIGDLCREGACAGWDPGELAEPALPAEPEPPAEPQPVQLRSWDCPDGWEPVDHPTLADEHGAPFHWCRPPGLPRLKLVNYTTPLREDEQAEQRPICDPASDGTFPLLGHDTCQPLGDACQAGDWPVIPDDVTGNRIYVLEGGTGTGGQLDPFGSIGDAVAAAIDGDVVVIGNGIFLESVTVDKRLTLWGKCVLESAVEAPGPHGGASAGVVVVSDGGEVGIRNLRLSGEQNGVFVGTGGSATLIGVWVHAATRHGVSVDGGSASLRNVLVDSGISDPDGDRGRGVGVYGGGQIQIETSTIERNHDLGIFVLGAGSRATLTDTAVRFTQSQTSSQDAGLGLLVQDGGQVEGTRMLLEGNRDASVAVIGEGSSTDFQDVIVLNTRKEQITQDAGFGMVSAQSAQLTGSRVRIDISRTGGLLVIGDAQAEMSDLIVRDSRGMVATNRAGRGLEVNTAGQLTVTRGVVEHNRDIGVACFGESTRMELTDVVVLDTLFEAADKEGGEGIDVERGADFTLTRGWVSGSYQHGIYLMGPDTVANLTDVIVSDTLGQESDGDWGSGLHAYDDVLVTVTRGLFETNRSAGVRATEGVTLQMEDILIRDTFPSREDPPEDGMGLSVGDTIQASCLRCLIETSHTLGIFATGPDSTVTLSDLTVTDTASAAADLTTGRGLEAHSGVQLTIERGLFERNRTHGLFLGMSGTHGELSDLIVRDTRPEEASGLDGFGLLVADEASVNLTRGLLERNHTIGLAVSRAGTQVVVEDLTVNDTQSKESNLELGLGIQVDSGARLTLNRGMLTDNRTHGIIAVHQDSEVELFDFTVTGTKGQESDSLGGSGLVAGLGAQVTVSRGLFKDNHEVGLASIHLGTLIHLEQVSIEATLPRECALGPEPTCLEVGIGNGLGAYRDSAITFSDIRILDSSLAGLQLASDGQLSGQGLSMDTNPIGANVQDAPDDYNFFEAITGLWMHDNLINFDSTELPVPDPLGWLE